MVLFFLFCVSFLVFAFCSCDLIAQLSVSICEIHHSLFANLLYCFNRNTFHRLAALSWMVNAGSEMFVKTVSYSRQSKYGRMHTGRNIREMSKSAGEHITQRTERCCAARQLLPKKVVEQSTGERGAGFLCCCWWGGAGVLITRCREEGKHIHQLHSSLHSGTEKVATQIQHISDLTQVVIVVTVIAVISITYVLIFITLLHTYSIRKSANKRSKLNSNPWQR